MFFEKFLKQIKQEILNPFIFSIYLQIFIEYIVLVKLVY